MRHQLAFNELVNYDAGQPSITVPITLSVSQTRVLCDAKVDTVSICAVSSPGSTKLHKPGAGEQHSSIAG